MIAGAITEAIRQASAGDHIRLQPGTYNETVVIDRAVTIFADIPGRTILVPPDDSCALLLSADATVSGLRIEGGNRRNVAIEVTAGSPMLAHLEIEGAGVGLLIHGSGAAPIVNSCRIRACRFGIHVKEEALGSFEDCHVEDALLYPLLVAEKSSVRFLHCAFLTARFGGVIVMEGAQAEFLNCEWFGSPTAKEKERSIHAQFCVLRDATASLVGCRIAGGSAAGVFSSGGVMSLIDCTMEKNAWSGVQVSDRGCASLLNCNTTANDGSGVTLLEASTAEISGLKASGNKIAGIAVLSRSEAKVKQSVLKGNKFGAGVRDGAKARFEDCDLRGNLQCAFSVSADSQNESINVQL